MSIGQPMNTGNACVPECWQAERWSIFHVDFLDHLKLSLNMNFGAKFSLWVWKGMNLQESGLSWNIRSLIHSVHKHKNPVLVFKVMWSLFFSLNPHYQMECIRRARKNMFVFTRERKIEREDVNSIIIYDESPVYFRQSGNCLIFFNWTTIFFNWCPC